MADMSLSCDSSLKHFIEGKTEGELEGTTRQGFRSKHLLDVLKGKKR